VPETWNTLHARGLPAQVPGPEEEEVTAAEILEGIRRFDERQARRVKEILEGGVGGWVATLLGDGVGRVLAFEGERARVRWQWYLEPRPGTVWESWTLIRHLKPARLARVDEGGRIRAGYETDGEADPWAPGVGRVNSFLDREWSRRLVRLNPAAPVE
jgi:hypothetical protein